MRNALAVHEVSTVQQMGWTGPKNGELLAVAESAGFDLFTLADKNLRYQQNLTGRTLGILELWTNHRPTLEKHFPLNHWGRLGQWDFMVCREPQKLGEELAKRAEGRGLSQTVRR